MANVTALKTNLKKVSGNYSTLSAKLAGVKKTAAEVRRKLEITKQITGQLTQVEDLLKTLSTVLLAVQIVPPISMTAGSLKRAADKLKKAVTPIRQKADRVEKKVKPVRQKLEVFEQELGRLIKEIDQEKKKADQFLTLITKTDVCIKSLARGPVKTEFRKDLEAFSGKANPVVVALNTVLVAMLRRCAQIENALQKIKKAIDVMTPVLKAIQAVLKKLKVLKKGLDPIRRALEKKITVKIPFKKLTFSIKKILTSLDRILGFVQKTVMNLAMKVLRPLLKKLKLNVDLKIPGLAKLKGQLDVLAAIPNLGLGSAVKQLNFAMGKMKRQLAGFDMVCPPN